MLSMSPMSGDQAGYYLGLAREDYYTMGGEPPGVWHGEGAKALGLSGYVEPDHLYNLFKGYSPDGSIPLVQLQRHEGKQEHRPGWDLTLSAPKSVSVLWSQSDQASRALLQDAHAAAVKAALGYLEKTFAVTRVGKRGATLEKAGLLISLFEHSTSRALDPQLHTHALVMNIGVGPDGRTRTLNSLPLFEAKMAAGAVYRAELSYQLQKLGVPLERKSFGFEVVGVPKELIEFFSKRRKAIEEELARKGLDSAQAAAVTAVETREAKEAVSRQILFKEWQLVGRAYGWSPEEVKRLFGAFIDVRDKDAEIKDALEIATNRLTQSQAHFTDKDFVQYLAEEAQCRGLSAEDVLGAAERHLTESRSIVRLGTFSGQARFTTAQMFELEAKLLDHVEALRQNESHTLSADVVMKALSTMGQLSEEQMKALWHITTETGAIAIVSGLAGTGKTRMLDAAREVWENSGFEVSGIALAGRAARGLEFGAHITSMSVAKYLYLIGEGRLALHEKSILVLDEAGMVATPEFEKLASICRDAGAKLVAVGDERQLQPIGPGAPFLELGERVGKAELLDIQRQKQAWASQMVKNLADGKTREALEELAKRGLINITDTKSEAMEALIRRWRTDGVTLGNALILAATRKDVTTLNQMAQYERLSSGELGAKNVHSGEYHFYEGDRVMFTQPSTVRGINNGDRGVVVFVDPKDAAITVRLDDGRQISLSLNDFPHVSLGYASTTHKAQGVTSQTTYALAGGSMQDRELSYVQASRAEELTHFFTTRVDAGDDIEQLVREMKRSRQKEMAHTIVRELSIDP